MLSGVFSHCKTTRVGKIAFVPILLLLSAKITHEKTADRLVYSSLRAYMSSYNMNPEESSRAGGHALFDHRVRVGVVFQCAECFFFGSSMGYVRIHEHTF
jgi:hypothetical protein